ncbi:Fc.00g066690.m01.CDS01 [Cosmosporella sp. VM-42]
MADASLTTHLLKALLPADLVETIHVYFLAPSSPVQTAKRHLLVHSQRLLNAAYPVIQPLLDRLLLLMSENQGVVGTVISLLVLATILVVLNWIRRLVLWWTRFTIKIATWAVVFLLAAWVWERGVWESVRDVVVIGGKVVGYMAVLKEVWVDEYNKYEAQQGMGGNIKGGRSSGR